MVKHLHLLIFTFLLAALSSCDSKLNMSVNVSSISGRLLSNSSVSALSTTTASYMALGCVAPSAELYRLSEAGERMEPALASSPLKLDGKFSFDPTLLKIPMFNNKPMWPLVVQIQGCSSGIYSRPITAVNDQDVSVGSTLISYLLNSDQKGQLPTALENSSSDLGILLKSLSTSSTYQEAYDLLQSNTLLQQKFSKLFLTTPVVLTTTSPEITTFLVPKTGQEGDPVPLSVSSNHWSSTYDTIYEWSVDNVFLGSTPSLAWTPGDNAQGTHTIRVRVGTNDGAGNINPSKPEKLLSQTVLVSNNRLPQVPSLSISSPVINGTNPINTTVLTLEIDTGAGLINCGSFSTLALTENVIDAPSDSSFNLSCTHQPLQNLAYTLASVTDGAKTLRLWAKDSAGIISAVPGQLIVNLDRSSPTAQITSPANALNNLTSRTFTFTATDNGGSIDHFECKLDAGAFAGCSSPLAISSLTQGSHSFSLRAIDTAGNSSAAVTQTWLTDLTAPVVTISSSPSAVTNQVSGTVSFSGSESGGAALAGFQCKVDGDAYQSCISPYMTVLSAGAHSVSIRALDSAGNTSLPQTFSWTIDLTAPTSSILTRPVAMTNSPSATFTFSSSDTGGGTIAGALCQLDGGAFTACSSPATYTGLSSGTHTFSIKATDTAGNVGTANTVSWTVDLTTPVPVISSKPVVMSNDASPSFVFSTTSPPDGSISGHECNVDNAGFSACASPYALSGLAQGTHTFIVRAVDNNSNRSTAVTYSWTVDLTMPTVLLSSNPASITSNLNANFVFSAADTGGATVANIKCQVDGGAFADCTSPLSLTLTSGSHSLSIKSTDSAGNISATTTYSWIIDTTAPTVSIASKPASLTNSQAASFTFSASDTGGGTIAGYECKLDSAVFGACSSTPSYASLTAGSHTFSVRVTDTASNVSAVASYTWTVDLTTPLASITTNPASVTNATSASFSFSANPPPSGSITGYLCNLDSAGFSSCTSPKSYGSLVQGSHVFQVRSVDNNGNQSGSATYSWIIDTTAPTLTIQTSPENPAAVKTGSFTFAAADTGGASVDGYTCKIDGAAYASCASPFNFSALTDGSHTFSVRATDTAANTSTVSSFTWSVDTTPPTVIIGSKPTSLNNLASGSFSFSATDMTGTISSYSCSLNGASSSSCTSPFSFSGLVGGTHNFSVTAKDNAGNVSAPASYSWTIDTSAPVVSISANPSSVTNATFANFSFSAVDSGGGTVSSYNCKLDTGAYASCTSPRSLTGLTQGPHSFSVTAVDSVGNVSNPSTYSWTVDTTIPTVTILSNPTSATSSNSASFTFSGADTGGGAVAEYSCKLDAGAFSTCSSPVSYSSLSEGSHTFSLRVSDTAGNISAVSTYTWTVDGTPPTVIIGTKPTSINNLTSGSISFSATDALGSVSSYQCSLDGATASACTSPLALSSLAAGGHSFSVTAVDNSGNASTAATHNWIVDLSAPVVTITANPLTVTNATSASFTFSASDTGGGAVASYSCTLDSGPASSCSSPKAFTSQTQGSHTFLVTATDTAGNVSTAASYTWTVDTTAPTVSFTTPAANGAVVQSSQLSSFTIGGACSENGRAVTISGSVNASVNCASNTWSTSVNFTALADGTLSLSAAHVDAATNPATTVTKTFIKDTVAPVLAINTPASLQGNGSYGTASWSLTELNVAASTNFNLEFFNGSSWSSVGTKPATTGSNSLSTYQLDPFTIPNANTSNARLRVTLTDAAGNSGNALTSTFLVDSILPVISSFTVNNGVASTTNNNVPLSFTASDDNKITSICFKYNDSVRPLGTDACWTPIQNTGVTAATSVTVTNFSYRIGLANGSYTVYAWMKDGIGNVSINTNTVNIDSGAVTFTSGLPPLITGVVAGGTDALSDPVTDTQLTVPSGSSVFIKWKADSSTGFTSTPIQLSYTMDDVNWTSFGIALPNAAGAGCTITGSQTGCYKWTNGSPSNFYFKIRVKGTDTQGLVAQNNSPSLNATAFKFHVGNTESGVGGSASAGVFLTTIQSDIRKGDFRSLVVHPSGTVYFKDAARGILKVDPADGIMRVLIPMTGTSSGDGGAVTSATLTAPSYIALDYQNNLLVWDSNRIRKINLSVTPATIETIIGGGNDDSDTVLDPLQLKIDGITKNSSNIGKFHPTPNGDIFFKSTCLNYNTTCFPRYRIYRRATNSVVSVYVGGAGVPGQSQIDVKNCSWVSLVPVIDNTNNISGFIGNILAPPNTGTNVTCSWNTSYNNVGIVLDINGNAVNNYTYVGGETQFILAKNNLIYGYRREAGTLQVYNSTSNTWTSLNTSGNGSCADGTLFSSCKITWDDIFVDPNGKIYLPERGAIRTVSDDNKIFTIMGQPLSYGDGLAANLARFGSLASLGVWNDGTFDRVVMLDQGEHRFREIALTTGATMTTLAGTGVSGAPNTSTLATSQPIFDTNSNSTANFFGLDTAGNIFLPSLSHQIGKLSRSTGIWSRFVGGGATNFNIGDGMLGTDLKYNETNGIANVFGVANGKILTRLGINGTNVVSYPSFKYFTTSTGVQSSFAGKNAPDVPIGPMCDVGTAVNDCNIPRGTDFKSLTYDPFDDRWIVGVNGYGIRTLKSTGTLDNYYNISTYKAFAINKAADREYFYYCDTNVTPNRIRKVDMKANPVTTTLLPWPVTSIACDGYNMIYSSSRNSLFFIFKQNGLNGVIEYPNP